MSNYHIKHLEEFFHVYRKSVNKPEEFWEEEAKVYCIVNPKEFK